MGAFIEEPAEAFKADDGKIIITSLALNNDAGKAFDGGVRAWLAQSPIKADTEYINEVIEPASPTVTDPMTTLASKNADVFISQLGGAACTQAVVEAAQNGMHESVKYLFQSSVCKSNGFMGKDKVGGDGSASEGWWIVGGGIKSFDTAAGDNDVWAQFARKQLEAAGIDWKTNAQHFSGNAMWGWTLEQALRIASELDGGLTRVNFMVALRNMDMTAPWLLEGAKLNMSGDKDAYFVEASEFGQYDAAKQSFVQQGDIIDLSGKSSNCAWDQSTAACG